MHLRGLFIYSNLLTAVSAGVLSFGIGLHNGNENTPLYAMFIGLSVFFVYNAQRIYKATGTYQQTDWLFWVQRHQKELKMMTVIGGMAAIITGFFCIEFTTVNFSLICISLLISIFYVVPIKGLSLRKIPFLKTLLVVFVWLILLVLIPESGSTSSPMALIYFPYFFGLALPFDIRDMNSDPTEIRTIPRFFGEKVSRWISVLCLALFYILFSAHYPPYLADPIYWFSFLWPSVLIVLLSIKGKIHRWTLIDLSMFFLGLSLIF